MSHSFPRNARGALRKKCPYSELFWSVFSRIQTEYREILRTFPYSVQMRENVDQNNSEYGHFLRSAESNTEARIFTILRPNSYNGKK